MYIGIPGLNIVSGQTAAAPSTALDINTATYSGNSFSTALQENQLKGMYLKPDGTKFYVIGYAADTVFQYTMATAYDLSTASYDSVSKNVTTEAKQPDGIEFKPDGTKMYISSQFPLGIFQYTLSTPWDVSTATYDSISYPSTETTLPLGVRLSPDGTKMFICSGAINDRVYGYTLSTPWNVSTASLDGSLSVTSQDGSPAGVFINEDGLSALVSGDFSNSIHQYAFGENFNITTLAYDSTSVDVSGQTGTPASPVASPAAGKLYFVGKNEDIIFQYDL